MVDLKCIWLMPIMAVLLVNAHTTQRPSQVADDSNPFFDMASAFLQETLANQNGGGGGGGMGGIASIIGSLMQPDGAKSGGGAGGIGAIASLIGNLMQPDSESGKSNGGGGQILAGIGSIISNMNQGNNEGGGGFDPSMIGNIIEMFTNSDSNSNSRQKRSNGNGSGLETILSLASTFLSNNNNNNNEGRKAKSQDDGLMSLLPMVVQAISSFSGAEGQKTQQRHKEHAFVLPPFLENIHVMWDHFSNSELAEVLWKKSGINAIFKGFTGRDGKLDYDKLFDSLENQSFRRRWLKSATLYLADWANYIANPEVYKRYVATAQMVSNGFLQSQGFPKHTHFDPQRPSETISSLVDYVAQRNLNINIDSNTYVKPAVNYINDLLKLGQARGLLQKFNATEISDKLTDTVNLEVIEPVLKVHRAYRYAVHTPQCDKYVLCEVNSHDPNEVLGLAGFKSGITKFGSMAASWFISSHSGTPFWTLFSIINDPLNCQEKFPIDCSGFHDGEAKVTTEYVHNEL